MNTRLKSAINARKLDWKGESDEITRQNCLELYEILKKQIRINLFPESKVFPFLQLQNITKTGWCPLT